MYKIWSAIENVFSKMRKYPVPTKEEAEELKRLRQEAGMTIPQVAEALHTNQARISDYENGKRGTDPELIEKLKTWNENFLFQTNTTKYDFFIFILK